jgi:hypothetical protein
MQQHTLPDRSWLKIAGVQKIAEVADFQSSECYHP